MTVADSATELLKHVLVLDRIAHARRVLHEESLGEDNLALPVETVADLAARRYVTFTSDAHHVGGDRFVEVPYACACGYRFEQGPVVTAWARHASRSAGISEEALLRHGVAHLRGDPTTATCDCGRAFAAILNPDWPAEALERWAAHVVEVA